MPTVSRSSLEFMRRNGFVNTPRSLMPIMDVSANKLYTIPLQRSQLVPALMLDAQGDPPPDRGITDQWPPAQEVTLDGSTTSESGQ